MDVDCNECGASLPIDAETRFVTCAKCAARLQVTREGAAIRTVVRASEEPHPTKAEEPARPPSVARYGEWVLRLVVGSLLIASDVYWWTTDPMMHATPVRVVLLVGGAGLVLSGVHRLVVRVRGLR